MTTRSSILLAAFAVVVLALGLYLGTGNREQQSVPAEQPVFPGLAGKLAQAAALDISQAGKTLHIIRKDKAWVLPDKGGYPAQDSRVHELLTGLAELKLAEPRTANADEYARLGVEDPPKEAANDGSAPGATLVQVLDGGGGAIARLIVGHSRAPSAGSADAVYVRRPGEAQAWLADGRLSAGTDPTDWLDQNITNIAADNIIGVKVTRGVEMLEFARDGAQLALKTTADHPKLDQFKVDDIGRALENLTLSDVRPGPAPGAPVGQAVFTTSDGLAVTATVSKNGDKIWATFAAAGDDKAHAAAAALAAKLTGWAYQIGAWKEAAFVPTLDQLKAYQTPPAAAKPAALAPGPAAK